MGYPIRSTDPKVFVNGRTFALRIQPIPLFDGDVPVFICGIFEQTSDGWITVHYINTKIIPGDITTAGGPQACANAVAALAQDFFASNPVVPTNGPPDMPASGFADIDRCVHEMRKIQLSPQLAPVAVTATYLM